MNFDEYMNRNISQSEREINKILVAQEIDNYRNFLPFKMTKKTKIASLIPDNIDAFVANLFFSLILAIFFIIAFVFYSAGSSPYTPIPVVEAFKFMLAFNILGAIAIVSYKKFNNVWWRMKINLRDRSDENINKIMHVFFVFYQNEYFDGSKKYNNLANLLKNNGSNSLINELFRDAIKECEKIYDKQKQQADWKLEHEAKNKALDSVKDYAVKNNAVSENSRKDLLIKALNKMN